MPGKIGAYEIRGVLSQTQQAIVYEAYAPDLERPVAIKLMLASPPDDPSFPLRFQREAQAEARLRHPNLVNLYSYGEHEGRPYIVMEFVRGGTLASRLASGPLAPVEAIRILAQIAGGLDYAHQQGYIHRDVEPSNILIDTDGRAVLCDFGVSKSLAQTGQVLTAAGKRVGTVAYMSPEQIYGEPSDGRSDLFSLGVVLYQALTGRLPRQASSLSTMLTAMRSEEAPALRSLNPRICPELEAMTHRAIARDRGYRFQTGAEFKQALQGVLPAQLAWEAQPRPAPPPPMPAPVYAAPAAPPTPIYTSSAPPQFPPAAASPYLVPPLPPRARSRSRLPWILGGLGALGVLGALAICATAVVVAMRGETSPTPAATAVARPPSGLIVTPGVTPGLTPGATPALTPGATPRATAVVTPGATVAVRTPAPNATPSVGPAVTPLAGNVIVSDSFVDNRNGWPADNIQSALDPGRYRIKTLSGDLFYGVSPGRTATDVAVEADLQKLSGGDGESYGVYVRSTQNVGFYIFAISDDGRYTVTRYVRSLSGYDRMSSGSVAVNRGAKNTLRLTAKGANFRFELNGRLLGTIDETKTFSSTGTFGVYVEKAELAVTRFVASVP